MYQPPNCVMEHISFEELQMYRNVLSAVEELRGTRVAELHNQEDFENWRDLYLQLGTAFYHQFNYFGDIIRQHGTEYDLNEWRVVKNLFFESLITEKGETMFTEPYNVDPSELN